MKIAAEKLLLVSSFRAETQKKFPGRLRALQTPEHSHEQIDREQPDENHLPEPQIARRPVIGRHLGIAVEELFPDTENVDAGEQNKREAKAEENPQREDGIAVHMDDGHGAISHKIPSLRTNRSVFKLP